MITTIRSHTHLRRKTASHGAFGKRKPYPIDPWKRDGFESREHYYVANRRTALVQALEDGESHPLFEVATSALSKGLLAAPAEATG